MRPKLCGTLEDPVGEAVDLLLQLAHLKSCEELNDRKGLYRTAGVGRCEVAHPEEGKVVYTRMDSEGVASFRGFPRVGAS